MENKQYKVGAILSYISLVIGNSIGLIYTPIMLRLLGQKEYGLYSLVGSMIATLGLVDLGFGNASIRYISKYRALGDKEKEYSVNGLFIFVNSIIAVLTLIIGYILSLYSGTLFSNGLTPNELQKFRIMLLVLVFNLAISFPFSIFGSIITSYEKFIFPKVVGIIRSILSPIVILLMLFIGYKSLAMVIVNTIVNILFLWVNVYYCFKVLKIRVSFKYFDFQLLKEISTYSFFIFVAIIVDKIYWTTDQIILGVYSGTAMVSIYAVASQLNTYYMQFSTAISGMFLPRVTAMVIKKSREQELTDLFIKIGRIQFIILGLILSGFVVFGKEFIVLWAGVEYMPAYYIALILITPFTIPLIQNIGIAILQAKNLHRVRSIILIFLAFGNLAISIPLGQLYGGVGCAIGTATSMVVGNILIMNLYYYKKVNINIPKFWKEIIRMSLPLITCIIIGIILNKIVGTGLIMLLMKMLVFSISYALLMYFVGMNQYEKELFVSPLRGIIKRIIKLGQGGSLLGKNTASN